MKNIFIGVCAVLLCGIGCSREQATSVNVFDGPSFGFSGSGRLAQFTVYAPKPSDRIAFPHPDVSTVLWRIRSKRGYFEGDRVNSLHLQYGKVPDGYIQVVPEEREKAPPLSQGKIYSFFAETTDAPTADGYFYIDRSGAKMTTVPDLCIKLLDGHEVRVKCATGELYQEPKDLESVVGTSPHGR